MASISAFNDMMGQFLVELHKTFPEEKGVKKMMASFDLLRKTNPKLVVDGFMNGVSPYSEKISNKDETFFINESQNIDFLRELDIISYWSKANDNTKSAIWQYLQTLYMLGTTITSIPEETLSQIEKIAKGVAANMENDGGEIDQAALMKMMGGMLGNLPKK